MRVETILVPTPPYDFELSFSFLGPNCPDPVARFEKGVYQRLWPLDGERSAFVSIMSIGTLTDPRLKLTLEGENLSDNDVNRCKNHVADTLCLDLDLEAFYDTVKKDRLLHDHCRKNIGLKPVLEPTLFEALTWAIIGQQVNLRFACQVKRGMLEQFAKRKTIDGHIFYQYPEPAELANLNPLTWRQFKCSTRKAEYVIGLAKQVQDGFDLGGLTRLSDEKIIEKLVQIRGIGRWTAEYVLIQGFGRWDALPTGDAGLLNGFKQVYGLDRKPTEEELREQAELWRPYRGLSTYYLWWGKQFERRTNA